MSLRFHGDTLVGPGMLDFAVNVWPASRPPWLEQALQHALETSDRYPNEEAATVSIAAQHGRRVDEVLLLNGACEAFWLLAHAYRPSLSVCVHPSFTEPEAALRAAGSEVVHVYREPGRWTFSAAEVPEAANLVVVGNPNNPTGSLDAPETLSGLARPGRLLVVDESFIDFVTFAEASLAGRGDVCGLVVVRSLTKLWSLPGIRAGYLLAPANVVESLRAQRQPWSVNTLACAALAACAADEETAASAAGAVVVAREELLAGLRELPGLRVWPGHANFLLFQVADGSDLVERLRARQIAVRPAAFFPGLNGDMIRIAVRAPEENALLLHALRELLA